MRIGQLDEATIERNRLAIGACGATSILDGLAQVLPPGIVVTSDPTYYIYADVLERKGFEILPVPEDAEGHGRRGCSSASCERWVRRRSRFRSSMW